MFWVALSHAVPNGKFSSRRRSVWSVLLRVRTDKGVHWLSETLTQTERGRMAENASSNWPRNRLLLALPSRNLKRLMPELEQIRCERAQVLMDADSSLDHVFFPIAVSSRWWPFIQTAASLRWQQSEGRAAPVCKPLSVQKVPQPSFSFKSRGAPQRCRARRLHGPCSQCRPSEVSWRLTSKPFSNRSWCRSRATVRTASSSGWRVGCS
jgi:hypothetical protein